ncbi:MAG: hypothetical protein J6V65_00525, partial [Fibrobacterales bacterium]|nr:hypothetical protein [Fibrobacterales bacterium]
YELDALLLDGNDVTSDVSDGQYTVQSVKRNRTLRATFRLKRYTVVATASAGGSVSPERATVEHGSSQTFTFSPSEGYQLAEVTVDGVPVIVENGSYTLSAVTGPRTVAATFSKQVFRVTATSAGNGTISPAFAEVEYGGSAQFTLTPNTGFVVDRVELDGVAGGAVGNVFTVSDVRSDRSVVAYFAGAQFTVTPSVSGSHGTISPDVPQSASYNGSVAFVFVPDPGWEVDQVLVSGHAVAPDGNSYTVNSITGDSTISVSFKQSVYTVTPHVLNPEGGSVSPSSAVQKTYGQSQAFAFTPNTGYKVKSVLVGDAEVCSGPSCTSWTVENISSNVDVYVEFELLRYAISVSVGAHGSMDPNVASIEVAHGQSQTFSWTPDQDYELDVLTVDGSPVVPQGSSYTFSNVTSAHSIAVTFRSAKFTIAASRSGQGVSISPSGETDVLRGASQTFSFQPTEAIYRVSDLLIDGVSNRDSVAAGHYTFVNVQAAHTIEVVGEEIPLYSLSISAVPAEGGSAEFANGATSVREGAGVSFSWTPETHWTLDYVTVNGARLQNPSSPHAIQNVAANQTVVVHFRRSHYVISASATGSGTITPPGEVLVAAGGSQSFSFTPSGDEYRLDQVLVNGQNVPAAVSAGSYTFSNVSADATIEARFAPRPKHTVTMTPDYVRGNSGTSSEPKGSITNCSGSSYEYQVLDGATACVVVTPRGGSQIDSLFVNGVAVAAAAGKTSAYTHTMTNVTEDKAVRAV